MALFCGQCFSGQKWNPLFLQLTHSSQRPRTKNPNLGGYLSGPLAPKSSSDVFFYWATLTLYLYHTYFYCKARNGEGICDDANKCLIDCSESTLGETCVSSTVNPATCPLDLACISKNGNGVCNFEGKCSVDCTTSRIGENCTKDNLTQPCIPTTACKCVDGSGICDDDDKCIRIACSSSKLGERCEIATGEQTCSASAPCVAIDGNGLCDSE